MGDVLQFPKLEMTMVTVVELPPGTAYTCEAPDWIIMKTTDDGKTWVPIGRLDPYTNPQGVR